MSGKLVYMATAQRYEVSTRPIPPIMGGTAALKWLANDVGWEFVYDRTKENYARLHGYLKATPKVHVLSGPGQAGLITFAIDGVKPADIVNELREHYIFGRTVIVTKPQGVRLSIGVWNRESDLQRIAEVVQDIAKRG